MARGDLQTQPALWRQLLLPVQAGEAPWLRFFRIFLGNVLLTGAYAFITVPKIILNGGVTSFSLVLQEWTGLSVAVWVDILTVALIAISFVFLGKNYFVGALFSSVCYMGLFNFFHWLGWELPLPEILGTPILATPIAAVFVAAGYYFCIGAKATAVSFDTIALILNKRNARFDIATTMMLINMLVLLSGMAAYSIVAVVCGLVFTFLQGQFLKRFLKWGGIEQIGE
ncbi:MAG: YitT family protein [Peptococcaceae bacterium]|nr:YitT family protein [Peptococcaceae bacterium]